MTTLSQADIAAAALLGVPLVCEAPGCPWAAVVEVQYHNAEGPRKQACREHAAPYRTQKMMGGEPVSRDDGIDPDEYAVRDSGRPNRRIHQGPGRTGRTAAPLFTEAELQLAAGTYTPFPGVAANYIEQMIARKMEETLRAPLPHLMPGSFTRIESAERL